MAQQVLQNALNVSPKAILRQKALGDIAYKNMDFALAERSFREVIKQGKNSAFKEATDYLKLANLLEGKQASEESLALLNDASRTFNSDPEALLQISTLQVIALKKAKHEEEANQVLVRIAKLSSQLPAKTLLVSELELAKSLILMGDESKGHAIIRRVIQSNHEDEESIANVKALFEELNMEDKGEEMIASLCEEVTLINNDGVKMVREGNLSGAIELFEKAADKLPGNRIINANAAQAFILYIKKHGKQPFLLTKIKTYLDRVRTIDPTNKELHILLSQYLELMKGV
jgi:tetratricopeptide (TPR) repeat protein